MPFLAQKICKERNCLVHLLSRDRKVSNGLDLSQKVVCEGSELRTAPRNAAVSRSDSLSLVTPMGRPNRGAEAWVSDPSPDPPRAFSLWPWGSHLPLLGTPLSSLVKTGGLVPVISRWAHWAHTFQLSRKASDRASDDGHAS